MSLEVNPRPELDAMTLGESYAYGLDITKELGSKTVDTYSYKIYNNSDVDVTSTFGGGSSISSGVITFGVTAITAGDYSLVFIITCSDLLPDGLNPYVFYVKLSMTIEAV